MDSALPMELDRLFALYGTGGGVFLLCVLAAEIFLRWNEGKSLLPKDGPANFSLFFFGPVLEGLIGNAILLAGLFWLYSLTPLRIPINGWTLPVYFLVGELCFYWFHRVGHEVRLLWADHSIHHSSPEYDFTTNLRHTPFSTLYRLIVWAPTALLGFHPALLVLCAMVTPAFQTFCHTTRIGRLAPWFEWLFVTPSNHAVHHARNPIYIDRNYGGLLMIWDHVFGTYQKLLDEEPAEFGITRQVNSANPLRILTWEFGHLFRDFAAAPGWRTKLGVLFGRPGYTFERGKAQATPETATLAA